MFQCERACLLPFSPRSFHGKAKLWFHTPRAGLQPLETFLGTTRPPCMLAKTWLWVGLDILIPRICLVYHLKAGFILRAVLCNFQLLKQEQHTGAHTHA